MSYRSYTKDQDPVMISALEHYSYCPRQCALIHVEHVWDENIYTMRGRHVHENVDIESAHDEGGVRRERALPIWSKRLNLVGKADLVEFNGNIPYPVEYKSGNRRKARHEELQLLAQAVCLEEMLDVAVPKGAIYWYGSRGRREIVFTDPMRAELEKVSSAVGAILANHFVPPPVNDKRCRDCSLRDACMPEVIEEKSRFRKIGNELYLIERGSNETTP